MAKEAVLDLKGMGGFVPYWSIEDLVKRTGEAVISVDEPVARLVTLWARRRGYSVEPLSSTTLRITLSQAPRRERRRSVSEELRIDEAGWSTELSAKLADISTIVEVVLKAPIIYRGPADIDEVSRAVRKPGMVLLRLHIGTSDYFFAVRDGAVVAAAKLGAQLSPAQARSVLEAAFREKNVSVTIYDVANVEI